MAKRRITKAERERVQAILDSLSEQYSKEYKCYLNHENALQLLIATMLSAQCTDERVNIVTKDLFQKYKTVEDFANANLRELERDIHSTGFYHNKAKNIIACCKELIRLYDGEVPNDLDALTNLAGVGRKTANVIRGNIFHEPSIVVDTHVKRISRKFGLTKEEDPVKIEFDLMDILPKDHWILYNIQVIAHGRSICTARNPQCETCFMNHLCKDYQNELKKRERKQAREAKKLEEAKRAEEVEAVDNIKMEATTEKTEEVKKAKTTKKTEETTKKPKPTE